MTWQPSKQTISFIEEHGVLLRAMIRLLFEYGATCRKQSDELNKTLSIRPTKEDPFAGFKVHDTLWFQLKAYLSNIAQASMLINPPPTRKARGETKESFKLRKTLSSGRQIALIDICGVLPEDPILDRSFRNCFVHIDEAIEDWYIRSEHHNFGNHFFGDEKILGGIAKEDVFEWYNPYEQKYIFRGTEFSVIGLAQSLLSCCDCIKNKSNILLEYGLDLRREI